MKPNCYNCLHYDKCNGDSFKMSISEHCDYFFPKASTKGNNKHDACTTLITICYWCKCDIKLKNWGERYKEWERVSHFCPGEVPKKPHYLCEKCFDKASMYSATWWYKYICADEDEYSNYENKRNNYWNMPSISGYSSGETKLLSKLKQLVVKYSEVVKDCDFNINEHPIIKAGG